MTKPKPIHFTGPMVRAILDGTKTQTRRIGKRWDAVEVGDRFYVSERVHILQVAAGPRIPRSWR